MGMTVRTNIASMKAAGELNHTTKRLGTSLERISSDLRISRAADDAAGLGVATNLETDTLSQEQAIRNANDGISIIQTAESATNEVVDILQRMPVAIQSSSETLDDDERAYIQDEFEELQDEIQRIASSTQFNGVSLTNASSDAGRPGRHHQPGLLAHHDRPDRPAHDRPRCGHRLPERADRHRRPDDAGVDRHRAGLGEQRPLGPGCGADRIDSAINNAMVFTEALSATESQIRDADFAYETSELTKQQIMQQAGVAALAQAKNMNQSVISLLS